MSVGDEATIYVTKHVTKIWMIPGVSTQMGCICVDSSWEKQWTLPVGHIDLHLQTERGKHVAVCLRLL